MPLPELLLDDPYHPLAWGEGAMGEQMRHSWKNRVLEVWEAMDAEGGVTWPFSEPGFEAVLTTEITGHLRIIGEEGPFVPHHHPMRNFRCGDLETKSPLLLPQLEHSFPVGLQVLGGPSDWSAACACCRRAVGQTWCVMGSGQREPFPRASCGSASPGVIHEMSSLISFCHDLWQQGPADMAVQC